MEPCSICYVELSKANYCHLNPCHHEFCKECILKLKASKCPFKCPLCRASIKSVINDQETILCTNAFGIGDSQSREDTIRVWRTVCQRVFLFIFLSMLAQTLMLLIFIYLVPFLSSKSFEYNSKQSEAISIRITNNREIAMMNPEEINVNISNSNVIINTFKRRNKTGSEKRRAKKRKEVALEAAGWINPKHRNDIQKRREVTAENRPQRHNNFDRFNVSDNNEQNSFSKTRSRFPKPVPANSNNNKMENLQSITLENLYSPSFWNKRFTPDGVIDEHVKFVTEETQRVKATIAYETWTYGSSGSPAEKIDFYEATKSSPILVYISGGYWQFLSGDISSYVVKPFHQSEISTAIVDYDRAPKVTLPQIVDQCVQATAKILEYAKKGTQNNQIYLSGHSAGAHLCAMVFGSKWFNDLPPQDKNLFKGVFFLGGIFDLTDLRKTSVNDPLNMNENEAKENSPLLLDSFKWPNVKAYTIAGGDESPIFISQGIAYAEKLKQAGILHSEFKLLKDIDHFNLVEDLAKEDYQLTKFMINAMKTQ